MKKVYINQEFIILEEEKKKLFGGVNITRKEISLDDVISVGRIQEDGILVAIDIMLNDDEEINLNIDEVFDLKQIYDELKVISNNGERFKIEVVEL